MLASAAPIAQSVPARVVAVGDIHGEYDGFVRLMQHARLADGSRRWAGGSATFVQTGDYLDRGPKAREVMDLLMSLEEEARRSKGQAIVLLGNHEAMNVIGDRRYVAPEAYASFATDRSERRVSAAWRELDQLRTRQNRALTEAGVAIPDVYQPKDEAAWRTAHPAGYFEYVDAFGPQGKYGRWLRRHQAIGRVADSLFLHGGVHPDLATRSVDDLNRQVRDELAAYDRLLARLVADGFALPFFTLDEVVQAAQAGVELARARGAAPTELPPYVLLLDIGNWLIANPNGPLWFRGYAEWTAEEENGRTAAILTRYRVARIVVGHTVQSTGRITPRFENRVFLIDTGMLSSWYKGGRGSALELANGAITALYEDGDVRLSSPR